MVAPPAETRSEVVSALRERVQRLGHFEPAAGVTVHSSGAAELDRLLPGGGLLGGTLVEWLAEGPGGGAMTLAMTAAREACRGGGTLVVLDRRGEFYPPAAGRLGMDLSRVVVLRAASPRDELWALDQTLRCEAVAAVCGKVEAIDGRTFRRLQLAAEKTGGLGLLVRPAEVRGLPSWSQVQLLVRSRPSRDGPRFRVEVVRCQGGVGGGIVELEMDVSTGILRDVSQRDETGPLHLAAELAHPAAPRRETPA